MWRKLLSLGVPAVKELPLPLLFLFYGSYAIAGGATVFVAVLAYYLTDSKTAAVAVSAIGFYLIVRHLPAFLFGGWEKRRRAFAGVAHSA